MQADIAAVCNVSDVVGWQEISTQEHIKAILGLQGWTTFWPSGNTPTPGKAIASSNYVPISWRTDRFTLLAAGGKKCIDGIAGVTPARYVVWVSLRDLDDGPGRAHLNGHNIHQAWTSHPERQDEWKAWADFATAKTQGLTATHAVIGSADLNRNKWQMPGAAMLYASHGTFGSAYYDALWLAGGAILASPVTRLALNSDHDALVATIRVP